MGEVSSVIERFKLMFPIYSDRIASYGMRGHHTVQIVTEGHDILVFRYEDEDNWSLMTMKGYVSILSENEKKGKKKNAGGDSSRR